MPTGPCMATDLPPAVLVLIAVGAVSPVCAQTNPAVANASLLQTVEGRYENREVKGGRVIGVETFRLTAYTDGSRCLLIWSNSAARGTQISANVCVDRAYRPIDAFARYWVNGVYRGTGWISVGASELTLTSSTGGAVTSQSVPLPAVFSIGTHPISADAWHAAAFGGDRSGISQSFTLNPTGDRNTPLGGQFVPLQVEQLGAGRVTVPAGTFDTRRIRLSGRTDYWVLEDDWIVVKSGGGESERVLVSLSRSTTNGTPDK